MSFLKTLPLFLQAQIYGLKCENKLVIQLIRLLYFSWEQWFVEMKKIMDGSSHRQTGLGTTIETQNEPKF